MEHTNLALPVYTEEQVAALNLIANSGNSFNLSLPAAEGVESVSWHLKMSAGRVLELQPQIETRLIIKWSGAQLGLDLPEDAVVCWLSQCLPEAAGIDLPDALRTAVLETMLNELKTAVGNTHVNMPVQLELAEQPLNLPYAWVVTVTAVNTTNSFQALLQADEAGLLLLGNYFSQLPTVPNPDFDDQQIAVCVRVLIGKTVLSATEIADIASGDVVLLDQYFVSQEGELLCGIHNGQAIKIKPHESEYIVTQGWSNIMTENEAQEPIDEVQILDLDTLPVQLSFDLGDRHMSLQELREIQPGTIFNLQRPLNDGAVMIRANGVLLGSGSLVEIDGQIGVCITNFGADRL